MLKALTIDNFKSFNNITKIDFAGLSILSGLNSSGKSSVYQALIGLYQSSQTYQIIPRVRLPIFCTYGNQLKLGTIQDIINDISRPLLLILEFDNIELKYIYRIIDNHILLTELTVQENKEGDKNPYYCKFTYDITNNEMFVDAENCLQFFEYEMNSLISEYLEDKNIIKDVKEIFYSDTVCFKKVFAPIFKENQLYAFSIPFEQVINCLEPSIKDKINNSQFTEYLVQEFSKLDKTHATLFLSGIGLGLDILNLSYVSPYRGVPQRYYDLTDTDDGGINRNFIDAANYSRKIAYRYVDNQLIYGTYLEALNYWAKTILGIDGIEQIQNIEGIITSILISQNGKKNLINTVGYGISQALPVIMEILDSKSHLCIIDEPEIHLHPSAQVEFGKFFFEMAKVGKQIIVETHSEYIINYLIYESLINPVENLLSMYWVNRYSKDSTVEKINWDKYGFISNRPSGFSDGMETIVSKMIEFRSKVD